MHLVTNPVTFNEPGSGPIARYISPQILVMAMTYRLESNKQKVIVFYKTAYEATRRSFLRSMVFTLVVFLLIGCGGSDEGGITLEDLPRYPGAIQVESMEQSTPGGLMGGKLEQFTTTDSYQDVLRFYTEALSEFDPETSSFDSELGQQTAISIPREKGILTVAVQVFEEEGMVSITFMSVGR